MAGLALVAGSVVMVGSGATAGTAGSPPRLAPSAANPTVEGPVSGGSGSPSLLLARYPLSKVGYAESEFFLSGTASSYTNVGPLGSDGKWSVGPAASAAYKTRIVVVRPSDPRAFSGTVMVEWFNVSGGSDGGPDWSLAHDEMIRNGDAYIGVSAQSVGVAALQTIDPPRYASLVHPGDSFSYDMFSQAGQAVREQAATILGGLKPKRLIAAGESQSA
jgi:Alpha/beta hydrolase domain